MYLSNYTDSINQLCENHNVEQLFVFGSVLTQRFNSDSDIDLLVKFKLPIPDYFTNYMNLKEKLEHVLSRSVDLVEDQAVKNPIFRNILDREKVLFYERKHS